MAKNENTRLRLSVGEETHGRGRTLLMKLMHGDAVAAVVSYAVPTAVIIGVREAAGA